ncbi:GDSL-type esterase/lipase family protein [Streptomyces tsukubensis]|uniref:SGNH hydrolase-type esterase domain-containing protein n=1 Tax=Streptomyces tsukubensis TaxID=83656 RepID=A0A1V4A6C2_9ACTN|nr:GDSL-type esterase/lipase family protein [Streptomyces tsukubensis]OON76653.1 hypothetical protein B1H18_20215 [Streptomyces tsukubensis]QFR93381.1 SGNH/GDSL hydrolase family protein [Streptomyces tsukubensis]
MRERSPRARAAVATVTAAVLAVLAGCSGADGGPAVPGGSSAGSGARSGPSWDRHPDSVASLGDSITRGFDACSVLVDCPKVSWSTGSSPEVDSLALRLLGKDKVADNSWNYARSGAKADDLPRQMERAAKREPALVTILIGANDACRGSVDAMTSVSSYRSDVERALRTLRRESPKTQVYVGSVPDLKRLWSEGRTNPLGKQVWKLGLCASMLSHPDSLDAGASERRDDVRDRVRAYNEALRDVCAKDSLCRYDGGAGFAYRFSGKQLSHWDWFHPNTNGQARLAEIAYRTVTAKHAPADATGG